MMKIAGSKHAGDLEEGSGILYLVHFNLEDKDLVKIGVTSRSIEERMSEILVSIFKQYRMFPYCRPKRFRKTGDAYQKEASLLSHYSNYCYTPEKKFSGSTEFIDFPLDDIVATYEELLKGDITYESLMGQPPHP